MVKLHLSHYQLNVILDILLCAFQLMYIENWLFKLRNLELVLIVILAQN